MTPAIDLRPDHRKIVNDILREHLAPGVTVWVFGSRAEWTTKDSSDLDLALEGDGPLDPQTVMALELAFEESLLPFRVDVVDLYSVDESFRRIVRRSRLALSLGANAELTSGRHATEEAGSQWGDAQWGDLATLEYGRTLRSYRESPGDVRVYGTNGPIGWHSEPICSYPTVIVGRKGAYRGVHYSPKPPYVIDTAFYLKPRQRTNTRWAYYVLLTNDINGLDAGSAIPSTRREDVYSLPVRVPPLSEQDAIAHVLGVLDDRIELNRRMNATLEAMARALFKSWFVDFDPVRAKMEERDTGLPQDIAALFPDRLVDSELGETPEDWISGCLADIADSPRRIVDPRDLEGDTPYIGLEHMPRRSVALWEWSHAANVTSTKYLFEKGEVLFGKLRPYFHKVGIAPCHGVCSTDIVVITPKKPAWASFVLACASSDDFVQYSNRASTGTKMPRTSWKVMRTFPLCLPPEGVVRQFQRLIAPWVDHLVDDVSTRLANSSLRDALLPKLVSGAVRLPATLVDRYVEPDVQVGS